MPFPQHLQLVLTSLLFTVAATLGIAQPGNLDLDSPFGGFGEPAESGEHVKAELVADVDSIVPGKPFRVGVRFTIDPLWHIYWTNPGESGFPTTVDWSVPDGFEVSELRLPTPHKFVEMGITSYGYDGETILFSEFIAPATFSGDAMISASANWLVCKIDGSCIPGNVEIKLSLPMGEGGPSDDHASIESYAEHVPVHVDALDSELPFDWSFTPSPVSIAPGGIQKVMVQVNPRAGWSLEPADEETAFFPGGADSFPFNPLSESEARERGGFQLEWTLETYSDITPGAVTIESVIAIQARRQDERWSIPVTVPLAVEVSGNSSAAASTPEPKATPGIEAASAPPKEGPPFSFLSKKAPESQSVLYLLILAFLGGIILNVMPCVLPVLSIKILSFVRQAGEDKSQILRLGLFFALGVIVSFFVLATIVVVLQGAGQQLGWGFQFQDPRFTIIMSAIVLAFGLSLFGVFSIDLPGSAVNNVEGLQHREGPVGAFFNGVLATALATPCSAPLLGPALGFAFTQSAPLVYLFFLLIALGLAAPYVLLSAFPDWLKVVPKPGTWMERFKEFMGFLLLGTVVWLVASLGPQLGTEGMVWTLAFLVAVAFACWVIGIGFDLRASKSTKVTAAILTLIILLCGYWYFPQRFLNRFNETISSDILNEAPEIEWLPYSHASVEAFAAEGRTMFIDFTADWCVTCKVNENGALASEKVRKAFSDLDIVPIKADYTRQPPEMTQVIRWFGRSGVPVYLVIPGGAPDQTVVLSELLQADSVVEAVKEAAAH